MKYLSMKKNIIAVLAACSVGYAGVSSAHDAGATLDPDGTISNFTGMAFVSCFDDGSGPSDRLQVSIRDNSPPVPGLLVNVQVYKSNKANSITDTVSGDANYSDVITLQGGQGVYWILVNKTDVGPREFDLQYHCIGTDGSTHTGTDIGVAQFGEPIFNPQ